jgi:hypothetical protein
LNNNSFQEAAGLLTHDVPTIKAEAERSDSGFIIEGQAKFPVQMSRGERPY